MEICITARHGSLSSDAAELIRQKVEKLTRFYDRVSSINVVIDLHKRGESGVHANDFFAASSGNNALSAVESVVQKLEQQLRRYKERVLHRGRQRRAS